jgi:hypothetical protein
VTTVVPHGGGVALPDLDQAGSGETLERLTDHRSGHTQYLRESALAGEHFSGRHFAAQYVRHDLLEDVLRYRSSSYGPQSHTTTMPGKWPDVKW